MVLSASTEQDPEQQFLLVHASSLFLSAPSGLVLLNNEAHDESQKSVPIMHSLTDSVPAFCSLGTFQYVPYHSWSTAWAAHVHQHYCNLCYGL